MTAATTATNAAAATATRATTPTSAASANAATSSAAANAARSLGGDMTTFLKLLTTQLRHQDPTQPMDPNQLTQQLAQFAGVEQQIATNQHMEALLGLQRTSALVAATPMMGRDVEVAADHLQLSNGTAQEVRLPAAAGNVTRARVALTDSTGAVIRDAIVPLGRAATGWSWDGRTSQGRPLADGRYGLTVTGVDATGGTTGPLAAVVAGTVTGISQDRDGVQLALGALTTGFDTLRRVK
ncbi:flagellar hook assembly protein FlgD [Falsiroseomonas ponticola]|uniref:flagellar hook assembly protein FlgD n=1 Tax=Falsiroseomonas ponticola TaxID=2786951 RepID=UPI001933BCC9|nr:flagellar hook assembly protein FlgD [Roseomonas ponticola]